ncbi:MAG: HNH endonuclease [Reyranella sp.]|nr:HNH endonuclease [Reyranella sp.]
MSSSYYGKKAWRDLRAAVLRRDPICATRGCGRPSSHADHVVPRSRGGADTLANLRGLCGPCHNRRSASGNAPLRAIGCDASGRPRDPGHPWLAEGDTPSKDQPLGASYRGGPRARTKFSGRGF